MAKRWSPGPSVGAESSDDEAHDIDDDVLVHSLNLSGMSMSSTASESPASPPNSARSLRILQNKGVRAFKQIEISKFFHELDSDE